MKYLTANVRLRLHFCICCYHVFVTVSELSLELILSCIFNPYNQQYDFAELRNASEMFNTLCIIFFAKRRIHGTWL